MCALAAVGLLSILGSVGCGDRTPSTGGASAEPAEGRPSDRIEKRLEEVQSQLEAVKDQSRDAGREIDSRLDRLDDEIEGLEFQIQNLVTEIRTEAMQSSAAPKVETKKTSAPASEKATAPASAAQAPAPPTKEMDADVKQEQEAEGDGGQASSRSFLSIILWAILFIAIFALVWIAFQRYGDAEDGDEAPPRKETQTSLGKIQFPPEAETPEAEGDPPSPSDDEVPADDDA